MGTNGMTTIYLNNKSILLTEKYSLDSVLNENGYQEGSFAVSLNRSFVPRFKHADTYLNDGDRIEIILPMQGG
jgi:sulfur carrier protein